MLKSLSYLILLVLAIEVVASCQKKEVKTLPRCIYDQPVIQQVFCQAARDEAAFSCFKRDPFFNLRWENLSYEEGQAWLAKIQAHYPLILKNLDNFRTNDAMGAPRVYDFGEIGVFSPSTLRLMAIAADVQQRENSLAQIVQIGAEYGSLCKILRVLFPDCKYTLVDLPEQLALAKKCLQEEQNVTFLTPEQLPKEGSYDLVISDQNFSEFNASYQELFFDRILACSLSGYILGRQFPKHFGVIAWTADELKMRLRKRFEFAEWEMQEPAADRENYLIYWKGVKKG